jgi:hypothetical protein
VPTWLPLAAAAPPSKSPTVPPALCPTCSHCKQ